MALSLKIVRDLDVTVMEMTGRVTLGEGSVQFRNAVRRAIWDGETKIVLDYSKINYHDSSAIGELFSAITIIRNSGGEMVFFGFTQKVRDLLIITRLMSALTVLPSREAAIEHFASRRSRQVQVNTRTFPGLAVVVIAGSLNEEFGAAKVLSATNSAFDAGAESVILLCRQVLDADQFGVDTVLAACQSVRLRNGILVLAGVEDRLAPALAPAALSAAIPIHPTLDDAIKALGFAVTHGPTIEVARVV